MANRFWVGGTGAWDDTSTANWSATSGGASGASAPTAADAVFFDAASGTGTCTTAATAVALSVSLNTSTLNLVLGANLTVTGSFTLSLGAINLTSYTFTTDSFLSGNANVRSIAFGTGNITLTGNNKNVWSNFTATNFTLMGTPTVNATYSGSTGTRTFQHGTTGENAISLNVTAGTDVVSIQQSYLDINFTGFNGTFSANTRSIFGSLTLSSGMTLVAGTAVTTFAATSGTQQITTNGKTLDFPVTQNSPGATLQLQDNLTMGSTRTFTLTAGTLDLVTRTLSTGLFSSSNSNTRSIAFGTGNITLTGNAATVWTTSTVTNFSVSGIPTINATYAGGSGTRSFVMGNAGEANAISVNVTAGTDTVSLSTTSGSYKNLIFTGFSGSLNLGNSIDIYGNFTLSSTTTVTSGTQALRFRATSGVQQITTNGVTIDRSLEFSNAGGTFAFQDALTQGSTRTFTILNGTVQLKNGVTSTVGSFVANNSNVKFLQSTTPGSQATLSQAAGTVNVVDLTIRDINAVGGAAWNAYTDFENTDAGNNDGWNFSLSPPYSTAELPITLRPFTQPRRF